jgi:hypothetical protein
MHTRLLERHCEEAGDPFGYPQGRLRNLALDNPLAFR